MPTLTHTQLRSLIALSAKHKRVLRQGDVKNASCNGILPTTETVIVKPPAGCPFSTPKTYWKLKKTLYGLCRPPKHWYDTMTKALNDIGLHNSHNAPCIFHSTLLKGKPPLFLVLYVDDFCYFSADDDVEPEFKNLLNQHFTVDYEEEVDWFLGQKFTWKTSADDVSCHLSQEAFTLDILQRFGLHECNTSKNATPFQSGLAVDMIPYSQLNIHDQSNLTEQFQEIIGCLTWLSITTRPDISTITSLLSQYQHKPSPGHKKASLNVLCYLASTTDFGIHFSSSENPDLIAFVKYPFDLDFTSFADAKWGPQDASVPKKHSPPILQNIQSLKSISGC